MAKKYWKKFYKKFTDYLYYDLNCYDNYVGNVIKTLRIFFNYLNEEKGLEIGNYHKQFYVTNEQIPIVVLSPGQLNKLIYDKDLEKNMPNNVIEAKNIFVFGCTVALRISDLMRLTWNNIYNEDGKTYLRVQSQKTDAFTSVKLPDYAIEIINKLKSKKRNTLLPKYSLDYLNNKFREVAKYININEVFVKTRNKRGVKHVIYKNEKTKNHYSLADHISSHTMRRTAITTMLRLGMPELLVRKISGHSAGSKEFFRYVEFAQSYMDSETDSVFAKIESLK